MAAPLRHLLLKSLLESLNGKTRHGNTIFSQMSSISKLGDTVESDWIRTTVGIVVMEQPSWNQMTAGIADQMWQGKRAAIAAIQVVKWMDRKTSEICSLKNV